jgi:hypothetical protein
MVRKAILVVCTAVTLTMAACTGGGSAKSTIPPSPSASAVASSSLVTRRASGPADIGAPGIQLPVNAHISFNVGSHEVFITASNWNTIVASTRVAPNVGVEFTSGFTWTTTTRNRFQYMADLIAEDEGSKNFDPLTIATTFKNDTAISAVALYNPGDRPGMLSGLHLRIISHPGETLVGTGDFFASAGSSLLIPAKTIIFTTLDCPVISQPKRTGNTWDVTDDFHYDNFS